MGPAMIQISEFLVLQGDKRLGQPYVSSGSNSNLAGPAEHVPVRRR
jgi:hypothetical protein